MAENTTPPVFKASKLGLLIGIVKLTLALPLFGVMYAYIHWYTPLLFVGALLPLTLSYFGGVLVAVEAKKANLNWSKKTISLLGLLAGAVILYVAWAVWLNLVENVSRDYELLGIKFLVSNISIAETLPLLTNPGQMLAMATRISEFGTWGLTEGAMVNGVFLWIFWLAEAVVAIWLTSYATSDESIINAAMKRQK